MTDNEIIKALECKGNGKMDCFSCTYSPRYPDCDRGAARDAIRLIHRQQAEIERLNGCVKSEEEVREIMKSQMMPMVKEIVNEQFDVAVKLARAEAIKEFAERLKEKLVEESYDDCQFFKVVGESEIDNLAKEMVGDSDA